MGTWLRVLGIGAACVALSVVQATGCAASDDGGGSGAVGGAGGGVAESGVDAPVGGSGGKGGSGGGSGGGTIVDSGGENTEDAGLGGDPKTCAHAAVAKTYIGCDFWPTVTLNAVWSIFDFAVVVANAQDV